MDLKKFVLEGNPVCRKEAVIVGDHFRITMLTTALIRFEYSEDGGFEDRATQMVCFFCKIGNNNLIFFIKSFFQHTTDHGRSHISASDKSDFHKSAPLLQFLLFSDNL